MDLNRRDLNRRDLNRRDSNRRDLNWRDLIRNVLYSLSRTCLTRMDSLN
jgi:hypothetical protein